MKFDKLSVFKFHQDFKNESQMDSWTVCPLLFELAFMTYGLSP